MYLRVSSILCVSFHQPVHNNGSSGYGSLGSNGSHEHYISVASSSDSNGNLWEDSHREPVRHRSDITCWEASSSTFALAKVNHTDTDTDVSVFLQMTLQQICADVNRVKSWGQQPYLDSSHKIALLGKPATGNAGPHLVNIRHENYTA